MTNLHNSISLAMEINYPEGKKTLKHTEIIHGHEGEIVRPWPRSKSLSFLNIVERPNDENLHHFTDEKSHAKAHKNL